MFFWIFILNNLADWLICSKKNTKIEILNKIEIRIRNFEFLVGSGEQNRYYDFIPIWTIFEFENFRSPLYFSWPLLPLPPPNTTTILVTSITIDLDMVRVTDTETINPNKPTSPSLWIHSDLLKILLEALHFNLPQLEELV